MHYYRILRFSLKQTIIDYIFNMFHLLKLVTFYPAYQPVDTYQDFIEQT